MEKLITDYLVQANCPMSQGGNLQDAYHKLVWMITTNKSSNPIIIKDHTFTLVEAQETRVWGEDVLRDCSLVLDGTVVYRTSLICG